MICVSNFYTNTCIKKAVGFLVLVNKEEDRTLSQSHFGYIFYKMTYLYT